MGSEDSDSLIKREQNQGALFPDELVEEAFLPLEKEGVYTGERLFKQRPLDYRKIVILSAQGIGQLKIAATVGVSHSTVRAVQRREGETIDIVKSALSEKFTDVASLAAEILRDRLERNPGAIETKDLFVGSGIAVDKALLLAGQATARLEISSVNVGAAEFAEFQRMMGGVAGEVGVKARECGAGAGAGATASAAAGDGRGDQAGAAGAGTVIDVVAIEERASDCESDGSGI